jgi:mono/diheme cytochrome c family protein
VLARVGALSGAGARAWLRLLALASLAAGSAPALAQGRGELLYETHCSGCHGSQMHWRERRQVQDWPGLRAQVRFWQAQAGLGWPDADIELVARHLNERYYRMPPPPDVPRAERGFGAWHSAAWAWKTDLAERASAAPR